MRAAPGAGAVAILGLLASSGAPRHPRSALAAARTGLPGVIALAARRSPGSVALVRDGESITTEALHRLMLDLAVDRDARPGGRIGVRSDGGIGFVALLAATLAAGADAVPLGPRHGAADLEALELDAVLAASVPERPSARSGTEAGTGTGRILVPSTGTTGAPRVTARSAPGLAGLAQLADVDRRIRLPRHGPLLLLAPPDHGHGLALLMAALLRGIPVVLASARRPEEQARAAAEHRPRSVSGVPAQLARLLAVGGAPSARLVVSGSAPLPPALRTAYERTGARVIDAFGTTEVGTVLVDGRPVAGVRVRISPDGTLTVRSPLGGPRWIATGDRAESAGGGRLRILGRADRLVDSGGELVDPERLRALLADHPGVAAATVEVVPDDLLGSVLHARVDADPALEPALRTAIAARLSRAEHPRRLAFAPFPPAEPGGTGGAGAAPYTRPGS